MTFKFDPMAMSREARKSEQGEHYSVVSSGSQYRLGVGARCSGSGKCTFFIEVSMQLCQHAPGFDIPALKRLTVILQSLKSMDYMISCEMGLVTCEKSLSAVEINNDLDAILEMLVP